MTALRKTDWYTEIVKGNVPGHSVVHKYGKNARIDSAATFRTIWNGGSVGVGAGPYTGFNATAAEILETQSSSALDVGIVLSSGTATGGTLTTLIDTGATFVSDGVTAGDVAVNDAGLSHGIVASVTETEITVWQWMEKVIPVVGNAYRIVTQGSTGAPVCRLSFLLDSNYDQTAEYIVLNGAGFVDTVGSYIRHSRARTTGGNNAGAITTRQKVTTANVTMVMPAMYNATMIAAYTIPRGHTGFILDWYGMLAGKTSANVEARFRRKSRGCAFQVLEEASMIGSGSSALSREYKAPKNSLAEMMDLEVEASSGTNNTVVTGGFELLLIQDGFM